MLSPGLSSSSDLKCLSIASLLVSESTTRMDLEITDTRVDRARLGALEDIEEEEEDEAILKKSTCTL